MEVMRCDLGVGLQEEVINLQVEVGMAALHSQRREVQSIDSKKHTLPGSDENSVAASSGTGGVH